VKEEEGDDKRKITRTRRAMTTQRMRALTRTLARRTKGRSRSTTTTKART